MLSRAIDLLSYSMELFVIKIYKPLFEYFDLEMLLLLLFPIILSVRFLLMPILGLRPFEAGSDTVRVGKKSDSTELTVV